MEVTQNISLQKKDWESSFFEKKMYDLQLKERVGIQEVKAVIKDLDFDIIESRVSTEVFENIEMLENLGFRTIDSRITFLTKISLENHLFSFQTDPKYNIRLYQANDLSSIKTLTHQNLTNNPLFISRYKNRHYFNEQQAQEYYNQWIQFSIKNESSSIAIATYQDQVIGFFIIQTEGKYLGYPLVKGILTAVDEKHRKQKLHLAMQTMLFKQVETSTFFLDNTTQISNIAVIKNHVTSNRKLHQICLTMMLKKEDL